VSRRPRGVLSGRRVAPDDRGAATIFVIGLSIMLLVMAGLVVDGGLAINARATAADIAEQGARAGAKEVDVGVLRRDNVVKIDPVRATQQADAFLADALDGNGVPVVNATPDQVEVIVTRQVDTALLGLVGFQSFTVRARATARAAVGIQNEIRAP
jgi:Flp pilus assembly protein TadG